MPKKTPQAHNEDILVVMNIDIDCTDVTYDTIDKSVSNQASNPYAGQTHGDILSDTLANAGHTGRAPEEKSFSHANFFEVRWNGMPFRIVPGETKLMPRYLAEHFAKHLADHVLQKRQKSGGPSLMQNREERLKVLREIITKVHQYYAGDMDIDHGEQAYQAVQGLNQETGAELDVGEVPNKAVGVLKDEPDYDSMIEDAEAEDKKKDTTAGYKNKASLIKEAKELGLELKGSETRDQIEQMVKNF